MVARIRSIHLALALAAASPLVSSAGAQQATTANLVGAGVGVGYLALSIGSIVRLAGHSRQARVGDRVRDRSTSRIGLLTAIDADSVTVRSDAGETRFSIDDVRRLRVSEGREHKWAQGWAIGLLAGGTLGAVVGLASKAPAEDPNCDFLCPTRNQDAVFGGLGAGVLGSLVGAGIGALASGERWSRISRFAQRVAVRPLSNSPGALVVRARLEF